LSEPVISFEGVTKRFGDLTAVDDLSFAVPAGGIFGSWVAAKTQLHVPEVVLNAMLGTVTGAVGLLYVINFFFPLPFRV